MAIGRPIELTPNITSKNISIAATEGQTDFTVTGGYRINEIAVYRNGVRLVDGRDFSATDGNTVTLISDTVDADDVVEFSVFDSFDVAGVIVSAASTQTLGGNLHITGELYAGDFLPSNLNVSGIGTIGIASVTDIRVSGAATVDGTLVAGSFSGDGSALTGIANTAYIVSVATTTGNLNVSGGQLIVGAGFSVGPAGVVTAASFVGNGANLTNLPSSTPTNITVADESSDTTCFPSFFTAATGDLAPKTGSNLTFNSSTGHLTANQLSGTLQTVAQANITSVGSLTGLTVTGDLFFDNGVEAGDDLRWDASASALIFEDEVSAKFGSGGDLEIRHTAAGSFIENNAHAGNTGSLYIRPKSSEEGITLVPDAGITIAYNNSTKIETTNDGTVITGIATATKFVGDLSDAVTSRWAVANNGSGNYAFTGPGGLSAASNSTLYLARGQTYEFNVNASGHPFHIQTSSGAYNASNLYTTGVTNAGAAVGVIKFEVPFSAPNALYYVCQYHSSMAGSIVVYPSI